MWPSPEPGDILWCCFPQRPRDVPGPKPRPALVLSVTVHEDGISVQVAYGTSQKLDRLMAGGFSVRKSENKAAYELAGLSYDTKFDLGHVLDLPWNSNLFDIPPKTQYGQTPKLGSLHIVMRKAFMSAARAAKL